MAEIIKDFVPEAGVKQVKNRVFGAADVEIDHSWLVAGPVIFRFVGNEASGVLRVAIAEVIPAGASPLWHGVGLADRAVRELDPFGGFGEDRLRGAAGFIIFERWREQR